MFQIVAINERKIIAIIMILMNNLLIISLVNLAGEYMDLVLALTLEWEDSRLQWNGTEWRSIQVASAKIWTPNIDLANRIYDYSPVTERYLKATIESDGKISDFGYKSFDLVFKIRHYLKVP